MSEADGARIIRGKTPESAAMLANVKRATAITAALNRLTFDDADKIRALFSELIGKKVDDSFLLIPPFYTAGGDEIRVGRNVFVNQNDTVERRANQHVLTRLCVAGFQPRDDLARLDARPFGHTQPFEAAGDLRRYRRLARRDHVAGRVEQRKLPRRIDGDDRRRRHDRRARPGRIPCLDADKHHRYGCERQPAAEPQIARRIARAHSERNGSIAAATLAG